MSTEYRYRAEMGSDYGRVYDSQDLGRTVARIEIIPPMTASEVWYILCRICSFLNK